MMSLMNQLWGMAPTRVSFAPCMPYFFLTPRVFIPFLFLPIKPVHLILCHPSHACIPYPSNPLFHARVSYSPICMAAFITHQTIRQTHFLTLRPSHIHYPFLTTFHNHISWYLSCLFFSQCPPENGFSLWIFKLIGIRRLSCFHPELRMVRSFLVVWTIMVPHNRVCLYLP